MSILTREWLSSGEGRCLTISRFLCADLSIKTPSVESDILYSRLFGRGKHNIWQFTDDELLTIDHEIESINPRIAALSYHGVRMNMDAARSVISTRVFLQKESAQSIPFEFLNLL
jgi:hypothetical protein